MFLPFFIVIALQFFSWWKHGHTDAPEHTPGPLCGSGQPVTSATSISRNGACQEQGAGSPCDLLPLSTVGSWPSKMRREKEEAALCQLCILVHLRSTHSSFSWQNPRGRIKRKGQVLLKRQKEEGQEWCHTSPISWQSVNRRKDDENELRMHFSKSDPFWHRN